VSSEFLFSGLVITLLILLGISTAVSGKVKDIDERVELLLKKMTLAEKIGQMTQINSFHGKIPEHLKQRIREGRWVRC
jgi:hypothetical protein